MRTKKIVLSVLVMLVLIAGACTPTAAPAPAEEVPQEVAPTEAPADTGGAIQQSQDTPTPVPVEEGMVFSEAPMLADMVASGDLPPVEERLPESYSVIQPRESIGTYGGTLNTASWWPEAGNVQLFFAVEAPIMWKADLTGYEPALVDSYEWSDDGLTFTMHLRSGLKWSDGEPYTSADWEFFWEDIAKNEDYKVVQVPAYLRNSDGTPITMEFPDELTVQWISDRPQWIQPYYMAQGTWEFAKTMMKPAHYLKQFHPDYTDGATYEDLEAADKWWQEPGFPCLFAWCMVERAEDSSWYRYERNPYYWRVDTAGNQLPYIDEIHTDIVADEQVRLLAASQGQYDAAFRSVSSPNDIPFLAEQAEAGGYRLLENWMNGAGAWPGYMVNQYYVEGGNNYDNDTPEKAAEIREILRDSRFRQALSIGFDRQRIIDVAWNGIGTPQAATISPQSWHFASDEGQQVLSDWQNLYTDFDAEAANALLDEVGMADTNGDGLRELPSGEPFTLVIDVTDWGGSLKVQTDAAAEMENQWETNIGIDVEVNNIQGQPDVDTRTNEGFYMLRAAHISEIDIWTYPDWIFPIVNRYVFPLEGRYYALGGEVCTPVEGQPYSCGVKPEEGSPAARMQDLYEQGLNESDVDARHAIVWEAIQVIMEEGPFIIGVSGDQVMPVLVNAKLRNVLDYGVVGPWAPATPGNQIVAQWYYEE
jgi:peptide/nickel transport system substrate-binding protein